MTGVVVSLNVCKLGFVGLAGEGKKLPLPKEFCAKALLKDVSMPSTSSIIVREERMSVNTLKQTISVMPDVII
jgi:hypothetical protein